MSEVLKLFKTYASTLFLLSRTLLNPNLPLYVVSVGPCAGAEGKACPVTSGSRQCMGNYCFVLNAVGRT